MCEASKDQRRAFRDQDPPRICNRIGASRSRDELESSKSTPSSPIGPQRASSIEKYSSESEVTDEQRLPQQRCARSADSTTQEVVGESGDRCHGAEDRGEHKRGERLREPPAKVPSSCGPASQVITNGLKCDSDSCGGLTNGRKMAPVLGVPPPPPPAPHMGADGLILPRKPYNPCLTSTNHKDLHRELLFNKKTGRNVLNQKSELQRALEKQREAASRKEAERNREESYKDDPRTALQRAIEQRARNIRLTQEQSQPASDAPSNLLITARAKLRPRTDSQ